MYKKFITPVYILNIVFQSLFDLVTPAAIAFFGAWLLDSYTEVGGWIYAALITPGVIIGFYSMICFIIRALAALEALEKQRSKKYGSKGSAANKNHQAEEEKRDEL